MINSEKKFNGFFVLSSFYFVAFNSLFCFCTYFEISIISFAENLCFFFSFTSSSSVADFPRLFVAFVAFIEVVSLWLVLVIVIGIPILIATKYFFSALEKRIKNLWYEPAQHLPFFFSHLLTTNFGRSRCLRGRWSIFTHWYLHRHRTAS